MRYLSSLQSFQYEQIHRKHSPITSYRDIAIHVIRQNTSKYVSVVTEETLLIESSFEVKCISAEV